MVVETFNVGPGSSSSADATAVVNNKPVGASTSTLIDPAGHITVDNAHYGEDGLGLVAGAYVNNLGGDGVAVGVSAGASVTINGIGKNINNAAAAAANAAAATIAAAAANAPSATAPIATPTTAVVASGTGDIW